jgi:hemerythrin-like metal-binding protein
MPFTRQRELIDREHADLASIVAQIRRATDAQDFRLTTLLLRDLQALEESHYASEEALMRAAGLELLARHRAEHAQLIDTLRSINQTILVENLRSVSPRIAAHLESALEHMHKSDSELWAMVAQMHT